MKNELQQFFGLKNKIDYLYSLWNWLDFTGLTIIFVVTVLTMCERLSHQPESIIPQEWFEFVNDIVPIPLDWLRIMAAIACCCVLAKIFDWLRLFEQTAFYILLMTETLKDVSSFLILLLTALMMFGVPMIMLNLNRGPDAQIVESTFSYWIFNMFLNQYLLALGEFNHANFADQPQAVMCYVFFIGATFFTQITMLNMLIAIMGDSFERVMENRDINATKMKLGFMDDMAGTVGQISSRDETDVFMFIVKPDEDELLDADEWEGTINKMTRLTQQNIESLNVKFEKKTEKLQNSLDEFMINNQVQGRHLKSYIDTVVKSS